MNIDEQLQTLSRQTCPKQVDVVDAVMAQVRQHPYMMPHVETRIAASPQPAASPSHRKVLWRRVTLSAAAAVAALVVLNISLRPSSYNEAQISDMMAYVSDYDYYLPVEEAAENPIDFLYEDYNE